MQLQSRIIVWYQSIKHKVGYVVTKTTRNDEYAHTTILQPLYESTCVSQHSQLRKLEEFDGANFYCLHITYAFGLGKSRWVLNGIGITHIISVLDHQRTCDYNCWRQIAQLSLTNRALRCITTNGKILKQSRDDKTITTPFCWWYVILLHRIDIAYSWTKFDDFRFSHSSDMIGAPKFSNGSHGLTPIRDSLSSVGCDLHIQPLHQICTLCDRQLWRCIRQCKM